MRRGHANDFLHLVTNHDRVEEQWRPVGGAEEAGGGRGGIEGDFSSARSTPTQHDVDTGRFLLLSGPFSMEAIRKSWLHQAHTCLMATVVSSTKLCFEMCCLFPNMHQLTVQHVTSCRRKPLEKTWLACDDAFLFVAYIQCRPHM